MRPWTLAGLVGVVLSSVSCGLEDQGLSGGLDGSVIALPEAAPSPTGDVNAADVPADTAMPPIDAGPDAQPGPDADAGPAPSDAPPPPPFDASDGSPTTTGVPCPDMPCPSGQSCCTLPNASPAVTCSASCKAGTITCVGPASCNGLLCCGTSTLNGGLACAVQASDTFCAAACNDAFDNTCNNSMEKFRSCQAKADCASDTGRPNCCDFTFAKKGFVCVASANQLGINSCK